MAPLSTVSPSHGEESTVYPSAIAPSNPGVPDFPLEYEAALEVPDDARFFAVVLFLIPQFAAFFPGFAMISLASLLRIAVIMLLPVITTAHDSVHSHPASQTQQSSSPPPRPIHPVPTNQHQQNNQTPPPSSRPPPPVPTNQHQQNNQTQHPGSRPARPTPTGQRPHRPHNSTRPKHKPKHDDGSKGPGNVSVGQW